MIFYFFIFVATLALSLFLTFIVKKIAERLQIVDEPSGENWRRKIHTRAIPLLGGSAVFLSYFSILFLFSDKFLSGNLMFNHLLGFFVGALVIIIGGILDDKYNLAPQKQIIFPLLAVIAVICGGVEITKITNPFGGYLNLQSLFFISPLLIAGWLLGMMYTTKLLDGVDGLVSGVSAIGGFIIFLFTLTTRYYQPDIAFAAIAFMAACLGFLIFNWHPARIFLGEGGSLLLGYVLGVLAIISGGKIAIALLVMGIPILDVVWTIIRRVAMGKNPFRFSDRQHLHHRLLNLGFSQRQTVLIFYLFSLVFGLSGLFLQSRGKLLALTGLLVLMFFLIVIFWIFDRKCELKKKPSLLLHICCAPCGTYISREILKPNYSLVWYFYNSNLNSRLEYDLRLDWVKKMAKKFEIPLLVEPYDHDSWLDKTWRGEADPERGERCRICYRDRLEKTAALAKEKGFNYFSTTLLVSPYKDSVAIKRISTELAGEYKVDFLTGIDFQADDAYRKSQSLAKELGIYRQKYCGCEFSNSSQEIIKEAI